MPLFQADTGAVPYEDPDSAAFPSYAATSPSFSTEVKNQVAEGPLAFLSRAAEQLGTAGHAILSREPNVPVEELNKRYSPEGESWFSQPMPDSVASMVARQKTDTLNRQASLERYTNSHALPMRLAAGAAGFALDPLNLASSFVPGIGEEAILGGLAKVGVTGFIGRTAARLGAGATAGAAAQVPISGIKMLASGPAEDYDLRQAMNDVFFGAAFNSVIHAGLGTIGEGIALAAKTATTKAAAMRAGVSQVLDGRPIDVAPVLDQEVPEVPRAAEPAGEPNEPQLAARDFLKTLGYTFDESTGKMTGFEPPSISDIARDQQSLYEGGFSPNMPAADVARAVSEVYEPKEEVPAAKPAEIAEPTGETPTGEAAPIEPNYTDVPTMGAEVQSPIEAGEKPAEDVIKPEELQATAKPGEAPSEPPHPPEDPEIEAALKALGPIPPDLYDDLNRAFSLSPDDLVGAYAQAAECLTGAGI